MDGHTDGQTDKSPCVLRDSVPFRTAAQKVALKKNEWEMAGMTCLGNKRIATMFLYMWRRATKLKMIASF